MLMAGCARTMGGNGECRVEGWRREGGREGGVDGGREGGGREGGNGRREMRDQGELHLGRREEHPGEKLAGTQRESGMQVAHACEHVPTERVLFPENMFSYKERERDASCTRLRTP